MVIVNRRDGDTVTFDTAEDFRIEDFGMLTVLKDGKSVATFRQWDDVIIAQEHVTLSV